MKVQGLLLIAVAAVACAGEPPGRGASASLAFGEGILGIDFCVKGIGMSTAAGLTLAIPELEPGAPYAEMANDACAAFVGIGRFQDGRAIRSRPASQARIGASALWSRASASGEALSIFGIAASGLRFVVLAEPPGGGMLAGEAPAAGDWSDDASKRFRFCGVEGGAVLGDLCAVDGGLGIAAKPGEDSGEGWRQGAAWRPATSVLSAAIAARYGGRIAGCPVEADGWLSCDTGSLVEPGAALSLRIAAGTPSGLSPGASLGIFAASGRFLTALAETPSRDFFADAKIDFIAGPLRFSLGSTAASLYGNGSSRLVKAEGLSPLNRLLWQWRVDMATLSIEAGLGPIVLRARGSADSGGPKDGVMALRLAPPELSGRSFRGARGTSSSSGTSGTYGTSGNRLAEFSGCLTARFARAAAASSDEEEDESGWDDEEDDEYAAVESSLADFALRSLRGEGCFAWNPPKGGIFGKGGATMALTGKRADGSWAIALSGSLSQSIAIATGFEIVVGIQTPSGGYAFDAAPDELPRISLDCAFPLW